MVLMNVKDGTEIYSINVDSIINVDNKAAIYISENETNNSKSRHVNIRYHHTRELIKQKKINL
jgi:hypothetical protein